MDIKLQGRDKIYDKRLVSLLAEAEVRLKDEDPTALLDTLLEEGEPNLKRLLHSDEKNIYSNQAALQLTHVALRLSTERDLRNHIECYDAETQKIKEGYKKFGWLVPQGRQETTENMKNMLLPIMQDKITAYLDLAEKALKWYEIKKETNEHIIVDQSKPLEADIYNRLVARRAFSTELEPEALPQPYKSAVEKTAQYWANILSNPQNNAKNNHKHPDPAATNQSPEKSSRAAAFQNANTPPKKSVMSPKQQERFKQALINNMLNSGRSIVKTTNHKDDLLTVALDQAGIALDEISVPAHMRSECTAEGHVKIFERGMLIQTIGAPEDHASTATKNNNGTKKRGLKNG